MKFKVIIPSRYASTRLPGKPLLDLGGKPLIQRVYERAQKSGAEAVVIATDDERIQAAAGKFGARVCMTLAAHASGTDRIAEVVRSEGYADDDIIVNLQGDEPLMPGRVIQQVAELLASDREASMATVCEHITDVRDVFDANVVKVVADVQGRALYFSRASIPWDHGHFEGDNTVNWDISQAYYRHIGLYAYRVGFLKRYATLPPCEMEKTEGLEQLRALYHGARILLAEAVEPTGFGVDTPADLERLRRMLSLV
jgi:3-deoxy-manno-octulosonate cytidylyltransferase (CMP-KDO synthetase)